MVLLGAQQHELIARIAAANTLGNLEGLFAFYAIGEEPAFPLIWEVNCATEEWLAANIDRLPHFPVLAELGYALSLFAVTTPKSAAGAFLDGLAALLDRPPFPHDRISFAYQPVAFLGLALGTVSLGERGSSYRAGLVKVLNDDRLVTSNIYQRLLYHYIRFVLTGEPVLIEDFRHYANADDLAMVEWGVRRGAFRLVPLQADLSTLQARVLAAGAVADTTSLAPSRAAILWSAMQAALVRSIEELVLSRSHVMAMLRRFEDALRRWRWDTGNVRNPICWPITSEREVQDIVWLLLRSVFDDVVDEDTLPKIGHSTYRADFGIPSLRLLVEVKYARAAADFKKLEKEIMEDSVAYLAEAHDRYDCILVFIYDQSASGQEHGITTNALRKLPSIEDIVIVSRPSHLPSSYPAPCGSKKPPNLTV
jgi:hypothetical protein